jgi:hypothetical protein
VSADDFRSSFMRNRPAQAALKTSLRTAIALSTAALMWCVSAHAASTDNATAIELAERVRNADTSAVLEIGRSGDSRAVALLLPLLNNPDYGAKREVWLALAKLGERESLQYFACRSLTAS